MGFLQGISGLFIVGRYSGVGDVPCTLKRTFIDQTSKFGHLRLDASEHVPDVACEALNQEFSLLPG